MKPFGGKINNFPYPIRQSVGALLSESDWGLHISKHFVHVAVMYPSPTRKLRRYDMFSFSAIVTLVSLNPTKADNVCEYLFKQSISPHICSSVQLYERGVSNM